MDTSKGMVVIESCTVLCEIGMPGLLRRGSVLLLGLPLPFDGSICSREIEGACRHREVPARAAVVVMAVVRGHSSVRYLVAVGLPRAPLYLAVVVVVDWSWIRWIRAVDCWSPLPTLGIIVKLRREHPSRQKKSRL